MRARAISCTGSPLMHIAWLSIQVATPRVGYIGCDWRICKLGRFECAFAKLIHAAREVALGSREASAPRAILRRDVAKVPLRASGEAHTSQKRDTW